MCLAVMPAASQTVTTTPATVTRSATGIVITFHADGGNKGLMGVASTTPVYAHTGVITGLSKSVTDWKYAPTWG